MAVKTRLVSTILAALCLLGVGVASNATDVFPTVTFVGFDSGTFTYTYQVDNPADSTYSFGYFQVDALVDDTITTWSLVGPIVNSVDQDWFSTYAPTTPTRDSLKWLADNTQQVAAGQVWSGIFKIIAPNTSPGLGYVLTKDTVLSSANYTAMSVPAPEPASLLAMATGLVGMAGMVWKRKQN